MSRITRRRLHRWAALALGTPGVLLLAACSSTSSTEQATSTSAAAAGAPCTHAAILTGAQADAGIGPVQSVAGFGCSGSWAYADVSVGAGSAAYDAVIVLQSHGTTWAVQDRGNACTNHLVPSDLYAKACTTS